MKNIPETMQAAVLHGIQDIRLEEVPTPVPREDEVLIEVLANGLCGSDIHFYDDGKLGPFVVDQPYIPGHEAVGRVVYENKYGPKRRIGDLVVIEPGIPCRSCEYCKSGRYNLCRKVVFLSAPPVNGTFAQYAAVTADFAHPIGTQMPLDEAVLIEPVSVGIQACNRSDLRAGQTAAVIGAGPIGLITLLTAQAYGASELIALDIQPHRLDKARELGVEHVVVAGRQDTVSQVMEFTGQRGVDVVFDTSGSCAGASLAPSLAKRGGIVTLVGWPEQSDCSFPLETVIEQELDVRGVNRYCNTYETAIQLVQSGKISAVSLISHRFTFAEVCEAFAYASEHRRETVKVVVS